MQQRFITNALFHSRNGLLRSSLKGVDRVILLKAVRSGLRNENGRTRGTFGSVSANHTFQIIFWIPMGTLPRSTGACRFWW